MLRPRMTPYLLKFKNMISIYQNVVSMYVIAGAIYKKIITKGHKSDCDITGVNNEL